MTIEINESLLKKAESLASDGLNQKEIAIHLGMGERTFYEKKDKFPQFSHALEVGRVKGVADIKNKFFEKAKDGDNHCMTLYLKNYSDLRDKTELDIPNGFTVHIGDKDAGNA